MKHFCKNLFLITAMLLVCTGALGQKRIYTKAYQIQDFKSKTTKIVLSGTPEFVASLRQEVTTLWTITPYEFCNQAEYDKNKENPDCYYLHPETIKGIVHLTLSRGGKENSSDALKLPVTLISFPICGENDESGRELIYMPAFISLIQDYADVAINSEISAYSGLRAIRTRPPKTMRIFTDPDEADEAFISQYTDSAAQLLITPDGNPNSKPRYKLVIGTSDYKLYGYGKN
ncbi:MAG: hypothetical protein IJU68_03675 [Bacteroidales bacterium]|nr:hypothetical protein [Bacteroidales bacterium]